MRALLHLVRKEFRQVFRDHDMLRVIFVVPLVQLFLFSYAANTDLKDVRVGLLDEDRTEASRRLAAAFTESDVFVQGPVADDPRALQALLDRQQAEITLRIPRGFAESIARGDALAPAVAVDGEHSNLAGRSAGYAQALIVRETARLLGEELGPPSGQASPGGGGIDLRERFFYNPELESRLYMVPGILVVLITVVSALLTGLAVVREKEIGTLEQLMVTPLTPAQLVAGKTLPFVVITFGELLFASTVAILWFDLPLRGSWLLLLGAAAIYLTVTLGFGLLASTVSSTQQQAMFTVWFFLVFGILMSGFFYPLESMPAWAERLTWINPARFMMSIVRGIFLKGSGFGDLWRDFAALAIMGCVIFSTAVKRFRKRVA